jgi:hypothetical protein
MPRGWLSMLSSLTCGVCAFVIGKVDQVFSDARRYDQDLRDQVRRYGRSVLHGRTLIEVNVP